MIRQAKRPTVAKAMPRKLDERSDTVRLQLVAPVSWVEQIEEWRAKQRPVPNVSVAIRQLVDLGLKSS